MHRSPEPQASSPGTLPPTRPAEPALTQAPLLPPTGHPINSSVSAPASRSVPALSTGLGPETRVLSAHSQQGLHGGPWEALLHPNPRAGSLCRCTEVYAHTAHTEATCTVHACSMPLPTAHAHVGTHTRHMCASLQATRTLHEHVPRTCKSGHGFGRVPLVARQPRHREKLALLAMRPAATGTATGTAWGPEVWAPPEAGKALEPVGGEVGDPITL